MKALLLVALFTDLALAQSASEPQHSQPGVDYQEEAAGISQNFLNITNDVKRVDLTDDGTVAGSLSISGTGNGLTFPHGTTQTTPAAAEIGWRLRANVIFNSSSC